MADSPVLYVYYRPDNDDAYPGVPARHITEADWARFSLSQRRTVENATTQEGYTRRKVWVHRDLVDETEQERADREAAEQAAREAYERGQSIVRWRDFEPLVPGPGEVIVGSADGPVAVPVDEIGGGTSSLTVADAVGEWWTSPLAMYQERPYPRTVFGAISKTGDVLACEFNHAAGTTRRYAVGVAPVDDHNVPAIWSEEGRRPLIMWNRHGTSPFIPLKVGSRSGDLASLVRAPQLFLSHPSVNLSYTQVFKIRHLSDQAQDTFWLFSRTSGIGWSVLEFSVDQADGTVTTGSWQDLCSPDYISIAEDYGAEQQTLRVAWANNPSYVGNSIRYFEINCETGAVTSPVDASVDANMNGTNLPLIRANIQPAVPSPGDGRSQRLFYVRSGPDTPAIAYADWDNADPDNARYKVMELGDPGARLVLSGTGDYARADHHASFNDPDGFTYTVVLRTPSEPATFGLGTRHSAGEGGWRFWQVANGTVSVSVEMSGGTVAHSIGYMPTWGEVVGYRLFVDPASGKMRRYYSTNPLDPTPAWVEMGSGAGITISGTVKETTEPLDVPRYVNQTAVAPEVYFVELRNSSGVVVASVDFRHEWAPGQASHTDVAGRSWSLVGNAEVEALGESGTVTEYGISGPRVGNIAASNYIAGMAFETPSYDGVVIQARSADGMEFVERITGAQVETLAEQPTSDGRLVRPYVPHGGGPLRAIVTDMKRYSPTSYNDYEGDMRGLG